MGYRKFDRLNPVTTRRLRARILQSRLAPTLDHLRVFRGDDLPAIKRLRQPTSNSSDPAAVKL